NMQLRTLFSTSPFYPVILILCPSLTLLCLFQVGPFFLSSEEIEVTIVNLAVQLSVLVLIMLLFQTLIFIFAAMEFIGELIGFVIKPVFNISEIYAVNAIS
ncbi:arginine transporter, partial [Staphylococcus pseudintermedius]